ncbi:MAG: DUF1080 domain-containing protein [Dysgonamonadaceae bacterium]|nr:DUF1080 domain-containing protein [Dysgonamonadaceae bacterium]MDD4729121.1 DUF1080 domain-containing protein [Dysgonamonadaceae bacterium]
MSVDAQVVTPLPDKSVQEAEGGVWSPQPREVSPGKVECYTPTPAPSDADILFDGFDLSQWESVNGGDAKWPVAEGVFTADKKLGNIRTKKIYRDFQLHLEWKIPVDVQDGTHSQHRGNSGVFLQGKYEIQILDSYRHPTYIDGQAGSIYKQSPPLVNAMNPPGEWNTYDVIYKAPTFTDDGEFITNPIVTVLHNGVLIQNHFIIKGKSAHDDGPIILQAHRDRTTTDVSFRNIWIREL